MSSWLALAAAAIPLACAAAEPDLLLELRLDPATRELAAVAELAHSPADFRFVPHKSLSVRSATRLASGKLRIEYGGTLPALERNIDFRGVLQALPPMASPEGTYLGSGSGWYPQPAALFTYRVRLVLEGRQKGLVAGRLLSEEQKEDLYSATFEFLVPSDGIDLMAGPYEVREKLAALPDGKPVRLRTYFFADLAGLAEGYLDDSARYVERYSKAIGAYPFSEFSVVASPLPSGFGMPTLTYIGAQVLKLPFIRASSLGHEVLHNWWGNGVLVEYAGGNWAEGLTTFMADYAYKEGESPEAARDMRLSWLRDLTAVPAGEQRSLAAFRSRAHGADAVVGYGKSAMLFFMLRDAIGEEAFTRGIRRFWDEKRFKTASWDDLRAAFEQASGRKLGVFFEQWLTRPGAPAVRVLSAQGERNLQVTLEQAKPAYSLRLPLEITFDSGSETRWVEIERERQAVSMQFKDRPRGVRLDPQLRVYRLLEREELPPILRQWFLARSPAVIFATKTKSGVMLAERLFESPYREVQALNGNAPVLIMGLHEELDRALARLSLPPRPALLTGKGSAQVWTVQGSASPVAVVSAKDEAALEALVRPLPHYGAQSYLAFEGARAIERGTWPPIAKSVPVTSSILPGADSPVPR
jgi:aminopeptidase N